MVAGQLLTRRAYGNMVPRMKTTVDLPESLLMDAKKRALDEHKPLRALIEDGLRLRLAAGPSPTRRRIRWVVAEGGVPEEVRDRTAMHDWLLDES